MVTLPIGVLLLFRVFVFFSPVLLIFDYTPHSSTAEQRTTNKTPETLRAFGTVATRAFVCLLSAV